MRQALALSDIGVIQMEEMQIRIEYTGKEPNMKPAASAFARTIRAAVTADGTFKDPELEAEFQQWIRARKEKSA